MRRITNEQGMINAELEVSNKEITIDNEELKILNEVLETNSEALRSANEALTATIKALRITNEQLNTAREYADGITQTVREPIIILGPDLRVISANRNFYKKFKVIKEDTEGKLIYTIGNNQWDIPALRKLLENILPERSSFDDFEVSHNFPLIGPKAMILNARQVGRKQLILLAIEDITEQKAAAEALIIISDRFRFMTESIPLKVFTTDHQGGIKYFNPRMLDYTGLSLDNVKTWNWAQSTHPDDVEQEIKLWQHSAKTGKPFYFEKRIRRADGEYRWHLSRAHALRDEQDKIIEWIGFATDIETVRHNRDLEARVTVLDEQSEQLVAINNTKDEFVLLVSHQLRTPATGVKQYIGMLLEGYAGKLSPQQLEMLNTAYSSNERQLKIVDDLLRVAQVDSGGMTINKSPTDVAKLLAEVIAEQHDSFSGRKQSVIFNNIKGKLVASVDQRLLRMVLENLIDNAGKYSTGGKNVTVNAKHNEGQLIIAIKDNGVGILKKDQAKLFQKFSRIDNPLSISSGGTGLGLYWAKEIMELHGGSLEVTSKINHGSTFTVTMPLS